jgi:hypothetical protein
MHNLLRIPAFLSLRVPRKGTAPMEIQLNWTTCFAVAGYILANPGVREALRWAIRVAFTIHWRRVAIPAYVLIAVVAMLAGTPAAAQMRRGTRSTTSAGAGTDPALAVAVASFSGVVKGINKGKKKLSIELEAGNTVDFLVSHKTKYFYGDKAIQLKDLTVDSDVKIDGTKDGFGSLTAIKITVKPPSEGDK